MFFTKKSTFTNFTEFRAEYCKFMITITRNNIHIKIIMTIICLIAGLVMAYYALGGMETDYEKALRESSTPASEEIRVNVLE